MIKGAYIMKKVIWSILLIVIGLFFVSCVSNSNGIENNESTLETSTNITGDNYFKKLAEGLTFDEVYDVVPKDITLKMGRYLFFQDTDKKSVVLFFDKNNHLKRMEAYAEPKPSLENAKKITEQTTIYELVENFGIPFYLGGGGFDFLGFSLESGFFVTTWGGMNEDNAVMAMLPTVTEENLSWTWTALE